VRACPRRGSFRVWKVADDIIGGESMGPGDELRLNDGMMGEEAPDESGESSSSAQRRLDVRRRRGRPLKENVCH